MDTTPTKFMAEREEELDDMMCQDFDALSESSIGSGLMVSSGKLDDFEKVDICGSSANVKITPTEFDRFIPNRPAKGGFSSNYDNKEFLFAKRHFECNYAMDEPISALQ